MSNYYEYSFNSTDPVVRSRAFKARLRTLILPIFITLSMIIANILEGNESRFSILSVPVGAFIVMLLSLMKPLFPRRWKVSANLHEVEYADERGSCSINWRDISSIHLTQGRITLLATNRMIELDRNNVSPYDWREIKMLIHYHLRDSFDFGDRLHAQGTRASLMFTLAYLSGLTLFFAVLVFGLMSPRLQGALLILFLIYCGVGVLIFGLINSKGHLLKRKNPYQNESS